MYTIKEQDIKETDHTEYYILGNNTGVVFNVKYAKFAELSEVEKELRQGKCLYERFIYNSRVKPYIDFDMKDADILIKNTRYVQEQRKDIKIALLSHLIKLFIKTLNDLGACVNINNILILDGSRMAFNGKKTYYKISYHLTTINNPYVFESPTHAGSVLLPLLKNNASLYKGSVYKYIDHEVYRKTQKFRTIGSYKTMKDADVPLTPIDIKLTQLYPDKYTDYLISVIPTDYIIIKRTEHKTTENEQGLSTIINSKRYTTDAKDGPLYNNVMNDNILKYMRVKVSTARSTGVHVNTDSNITYYTYTYDPTLNKCIYGKKHQRPERDTSILYAYISNGAIYSGCYGTKCKARKKVKIGTVLPISPMETDGVQINSKYISECNEFKDNIQKFINTDDIKAFAIRSGYGTGKTYMLNKYIAEIDTNIYNKTGRRARILMISTRRSYARAVVNSNLKELNIINYLDLDPDVKLNTIPRLIISLESLHKITDGIYDYYDIVILDESESIARQILSRNTIKTDLYLNYAQLQDIIYYAAKVFILDADLNAPSLELVSMYTKDNIIKINNTYKQKQRTYTITNNKNLFINDIIDKLKAGDRSYIVCLSIDTSKYYKEYLISQGIREDRIKLINSGSDEDDIIKLGNVNEFWSGYDIVITTSTTGAGVDFNRQHFNNIYGIITTGSATPAEFLQILNRVRIFTNSNILIYGDRINYKVNDAYLYTYDYVSVISSQISKIPLKRTINYAVEDINTGIISNQILRMDDPLYDSYNNLVIHNELSGNYNKRAYNYLLMIKLLLEAQGHIFLVDYDSKLRHKNQPKTSATELYEADISGICGSELRLIKNKTAIQKTQITKITLCNKYNIAVSHRGDVSEDFIKNAYKTHDAKIHNILKLHITDKNADNLKKAAKVLPELTDHKNEALANIYYRIVSGLNYTYKPSVHVPDDIYNKMIADISITENERAVLKSKGHLQKPELIVKAVLNRYGLNIKKALKSKIKGTRTYDGYTITPDIKTYALLKNHIYKDIDKHIYNHDLINLIKHTEYDVYIQYTKMRNLFI